jgi:hypothetical protein
MTEAEEAVIKSQKALEEVMAQAEEVSRLCAEIKASIDRLTKE